MVRYHISPKTGLPTKCHAQKGKCPYGGRTGNEGHFKSYSAALVEAQKILEKKHDILPFDTSDYSSDKFEEEYNKLTERENELPHNQYELKDYIRETEDQELLMDIINGKLFYADGWDKAAIALQNKNLPKDFINDVIYENPDNYSLELRRRIMLNESLSHEDLIYVAENSDDLYTRTIAFSNKNIRADYIHDFFDNRKEDLTKLPWHMMIQNPNVDREKYVDWYTWAIVDYKKMNTSEFSDFYDKYKDWKDSNAKNK